MISFIEVKKITEFHYPHPGLITVDLLQQEITSRLSV